MHILVHMALWARAQSIEQVAHEWEIAQIVGKRRHSTSLSDSSCTSATCV